jgi:hypothetical protein
MNMKQAAAQLQKAMSKLMGTHPTKRASPGKARPKKAAAKRTTKNSRKSRSARGR